MNDLRTAAQQALNDLKDLQANHNIMCAGTISRLEAALAQEQAEPAQEPVAVVRWNDIGHISWRNLVMLPDGTPLYTAPPQRKPLTDGELMGAYIDFDRTSNRAWSRAEYLLHLCRAIERALEEKNRGR